MLAAILSQAADVDAERLFRPAWISKKNLLAENVLQLLLQPEDNFAYRAGQFINIKHPQGEVRSYSLASVPDNDEWLELHIKKKVRGTMTSWLFDRARVGDVIDIQDAMGTCFYPLKDLNTPLILIGSGTGPHHCLTKLEMPSNITIRVKSIFIMAPVVWMVCIYTGNLVLLPKTLGISFTIPA
ncbi:MAG: putative ferric reductase [Paraglaciecola sp.]